MEWEVLINVIIQPAPTVWISPPRLETSVAAHRLRKAWLLNGASVELFCCIGFRNKAIVRFNLGDSRKSRKPDMGRCPTAL